MCERPSEVDEDNDCCDSGGNRRQVAGNVDIDQLSSSLQHHHYRLDAFLRRQLEYAEFDYPGPQVEF